MCVAIELWCEMDSKPFLSSDTGRLVDTINGQKAFVPNALPPQLDLSNMLDLFGQASAALGGLDKIGSTLANPYMVIRPLQRNEALRSSAMEGTYSTADNIAIVEALDDGSKDSSASEVLNYIRAIDYAQEALEELPISHRVIRGMHEVLLRGVSKNRGANKRPGSYKVHQNWIGALEIENARFVPPPPDASIKCMDELEAYLNSGSLGVPPLIAAALIHYQFETIHPFGDGNGRVGRMLITLFLQSQGLIKSPILYVSPYIDANKDEYIDSMFAVSQDGDWERWLRYFLQAIIESCSGTMQTIEHLNVLQEHYRSLLQEKTKSVSALRLADFLFERPVISITDASRVANISYQAARKTVDQLCAHEILAQVPGFEKPKLFLAPDVLAISDGNRVSG